MRLSPEMGRVVDSRIILTVVRRKTPTVSSGRQAAVLKASGRAVRTPPGSKSRACLHRGNSGTWESHVSPCQPPGLGDRVPKGPGVVWGLRPAHEPVRDTTNTTEAGKGSGSERRAKRLERGTVAVLAEHSTEEGGEPSPTGPTGGKATPGITWWWMERREIL
jgi:hypothetical protein